MYFYSLIYNNIFYILLNINNNWKANALDSMPVNRKRKLKKGKERKLYINLIQVKVQNNNIIYNNKKKLFTLVLAIRIL